MELKENRMGTGIARECAFSIGSKPPFSTGCATGIAISVLKGGPLVLGQITDTKGVLKNKKEIR